MRLRPQVVNLYSQYLCLSGRLTLTYWKHSNVIAVEFIRAYIDRLQFSLLCELAFSRGFGVFVGLQAALNLCITIFSPFSNPQREKSLSISNQGYIPIYDAHDSLNFPSLGLWLIPKPE